MDDHNLYCMFWPYMWDFLRIPHLQKARFFMFFQFWRDQSFFLPDIFHSWGTFYQHFFKLLTSRNKDEDLTMACHLWFSNKTTTGYHLKIYYFITNLLKLGLNHHNMGLGQATYDFPIWMGGENSSSSSDANFLIEQHVSNTKPKNFRECPKHFLGKDTKPLGIFGWLQQLRLGWLVLVAPAVLAGPSSLGALMVCDVFRVPGSSGLWILGFCSEFFFLWYINLQLLA